MFNTNSHINKQRILHRNIKTTCIIIVLSVVLCLQLLIWYGGRDAGVPAEADYILILGSRVDDGELSKTLQLRMQTALPYIDKFPDAKIVVSGGIDSDNTISEAEAMRQYLLDSGITDERILLEQQSTSTYENLLYTKRLLSSDSRVVIVTSDYHMFRTKMLATHLDYNMQGLPAPSVAHLKIRYHARESLAIIKSIVFDIIF